MAIDIVHEQGYLIWIYARQCHKASSPPSFRIERVLPSLHTFFSFIVDSCPSKSDSCERENTVIPLLLSFFLFRRCNRSNGHIVKCGWLLAIPLRNTANAYAFTILYSIFNVWRARSICGGVCVCVCGWNKKLSPSIAHKTNPKSTERNVAV